MNKEIEKSIIELVKVVLTDKEIMTPYMRGQIIKTLDRNLALTSVYSLDLDEVEDIRYTGRHCSQAIEKSGWYFKFRGTRCGINFFVDNNMVIRRKPCKDVEVAHSYKIYAHNEFDEGFWQDNFL